jgi:hypothetical protein
VNFSLKIFHFYFYALVIYLFFNVFVIVQGSFLGINIFKIQMVEAFIIGAAAFHVFQLALSKNIILVQKRVFITQSLFLAYSVLSSVLLIRFDYQVVYIGYIIYYMLLFFAINLSLFFVDTRELKSTIESLFKTCYEVFGCSAIVLFFLALLQFILKSPLFELKGEGGKELLVKAELLGTFRPPAIFRSSYEYGILATFVFSLSLSKLLSPNKTIRDYLFFAFALLGVLICQTRNIYFYSLMSAFIIIVIQYYQSIHKAIIKSLPFLFTILLHLLLFYLSFDAIYGDSASTGFADKSSTIVRYTYFIRLFEGYISTSHWYDYFLGWGLIQHAGDSSLISIFPDVFNDDDGTLGFDNLILSVFMYSGGVGVALYLFLYYRIWSVIINMLNKSESSFILGFAGFFGAYLAAGVFNLINIGPWSVFTWFMASMVIVYGSLKNEL